MAVNIPIWPGSSSFTSGDTPFGHYDSDSDFIKDRRKYSYEGVVLISILINQDQSIHKNIHLSIVSINLISISHTLHWD